MASNGLVANAKKTAFLVLNGRQVPEDLSVQIGGVNVPREKSACLLGVKFQDNLQWRSQIYGKGGLLSQLNSRLYIIRRLQSHLCKKAVLKVVDGLFTSKLRYGLQLYGKVRTKESDPKCEDFGSIQLIQNNLMRSLNGTKVKDMVSISSLLEKFGMLSINQLNAQVKLSEMWKALNVEDYPLRVELQTRSENQVCTRADSIRKPKEIGKTNLAQKSCISDAIRVWNLAPDHLKGGNSLALSKKEIKKIC